MNIFKHELKANLKPFIFWTIGLFVLVFAGMTKYTGLKEGGEAVDQMLAAFPRILKAMLGMVDINVTKLSGYYAVLMYYALICIAIYAISLGANAVGGEAVDKTYEFLFTKPCSRSHVLGMKLCAGLVYLLSFGILSYVFSLSSIAALQLDVNISEVILSFNLSLVLVGVLFFFMSAMLVALIKHTEKGFLYGNLIFVAMFILGILYDMLENAEALRLFTPLRYFTSAEILDQKSNPTFIVLSFVLSIIFAVVTFLVFKKKDLQASN
ncbi:MAG: ABC transporter permease subunit [Clostridiaceae bacterium]|nr:ABC transporter permease subunit [Clostridiaceae bacterium]